MHAWSYKQNHISKFGQFLGIPGIILLHTTVYRVGNMDY